MKKLEELLNVLLPKKALHEYGVREVELETFTDSVMTEQGRLMANNFVPLSREQVLEITGNYIRIGLTTNSFS